MKKNLILLLLAFLTVAPAMAQRVVDRLDRGLVAQKTATGVLLTWRIPGEEYYDVTYNVYRNGEKIASELNVSNYVDAAGTTSNQYSVAAVVRGVEKPQCKNVGVWNSSFLEIAPRHDASLKSVYVPNDACCADVDGDGEVEILMKYDNASEAGQSYPKNGPVVGGVTTKEYSLFECIKLDGTVLWWVNCGPNMGDFQNNEQNIVGYDWNCDGKAEVVMRLLEGSSIHYADGTTYTIGADGKNGTSWVNYRAATGGGTNWFMHDGKEFLVYCNGQTGQIFDIIPFPLARLEAGESDLNAAWGDGYGHRCSKFFFGAPYLDGKKPSIFLARGIYTRHKMAAFDVDPATNKLVQRWKWYNNTNGPWKGQGYHNYAIADVDMDGRDEIVFGSMVIDDNGKGLSTTGYGHGDAQHCGDFNPFIHGLEQFACNEDAQGFNYRDATTSKPYAATLHVGSDIGRSMCGNFSNTYVGCIGTAYGDPISTVTNKPIPGMGSTGINSNMRIYWDGDLLEETFNYQNGKNTAGIVAKYGSWSGIYVCEGSLTNNDTKGTPCFQGDIFGDWREEIIMRTANNNIRIYTTPTTTKYRNYSLWHDHQYRNGMVWQMCGYNQPPHVSYFLGELEGITVAPPPLTMTDREEVVNGGTISAALNDKHVIVRETANTTVSIEDGAKPYILTFNVPSWVQGTAPSECSTKDTPINYLYYTCNVTGGALAGNARLVKQGDGILNLPKVDMTHTGETKIWEGIVNFDGTMHNSDVWLNRFTTLSSNGGAFKSIRAQYDAKIVPGGAKNIGSITVDGTLYMDYGSRLVLDINGKDCDQISAKELTIIKKTGTPWTQYGPEFIQPVIEINGVDLAEGDYVLGHFESMNGTVTGIKVVGIEGFKTALKYENGDLVLTLGGTRGPSTVYWTGSTNGTWNYGTTENFVVADDKEQTPDVFVNGDLVEFNDNAKTFNVNIVDEVKVDTVKFVSANDYTLSGTGSIAAGALVKEGIGTLTINNINTYAGGNFLRGGTVVVSALANEIDPTGNLGARTSSQSKFTFENGAVLQTTGNVTNGSPMSMLGEEGGVINNGATFTQEKTMTGTLLTKKGNGTLNVNANCGTLSRLVVTAGTLATNQAQPARTVEMQAGTLNLNAGASCTINVPAGKTTRVNFYDGRGTYSNQLTGAGTVTVYHSTATGAVNYAMRTSIAGNWSAFTGIVRPVGLSGDGRFVFNNSYGLPNATVELDNGNSIHTVGQTFTIGAVTGKGNLSGYISLSQSGSGTATWKVGSKNTDFQYDGKVTGGSVFHKVGTGKMTVSGAWDTNGTINVAAGALELKATSCLGTGALTVAADATLMGVTATKADNGYIIKNSTVTVNGRLMPANSETSALTTSVMYFNGQNVTVSKTGSIFFTVRKAATNSETAMSGSSIKNIGTLTVNGTIIVNVNPGTTWTPAVGDSIRLWTGVKTLAGTPTVVSLDGNVEFDTRSLDHGVLYIKSLNTGIKHIEADENVVVTAYSTGSTPVASFETTYGNLNSELRNANLPKGVYIFKIKCGAGIITEKRQVK